MESQCFSQYNFNNGQAISEMLFLSISARSTSHRNTMKNLKLTHCIKADIVLLFAVCLLYTKICSSSNIGTRCGVNISEKGTHDLIETSFTDCLKKSLYPMAVILNQSGFECSLWQPKTSESYFLVNFEKLMSEQSYSFEEKHMFKSKNASKLSSKQILIFEDMKSINLHPILDKMTSTHFWNPESIFIIKITKIYGSCNLVTDLFNIIWSFNVVNGYFMCHHPQYGTVLYTFNPYSSFAPKPWIRVETYKQHNGHPLTIFMNYERKDICKSLFWDKAIKLSHFPVKVANITFSRYLEDADGGRKEEATDIIYQINDIIWKKLEAKIVSKKFSWDEVGNVDGESGKATKITSLVLHGKYECLVSVDFERGFWKNEVNLFTKTGMCFVTRKTLASIFEHLSEAFPLLTWLSFLLLFISTILLLTYLLKINYQDVAIDVLRMTIGTAMIHETKSNLSNVIIIYLLLIFAIINTHLQSKLQMLLTVETSHTVLENLTALVENDYEIYSTPYYWQYYSAQTDFRDKIKIDKDFEGCLKLTQYNNKVACLNDCYDIVYGIQKRTDLVSYQDDIVNKYNVQLFRDDSVLKDRFQKIYNNLFESGIPNFLYKITDLNYRRNLHSDFGAISMFQLNFAFVFLLTLHTVSSVVFLCDIFRVYERFESWFDVE